MTNQAQAHMANAPVLMEVLRGKDAQGQSIIECVHHGIIGVMEGNGKVIYENGDSNTYVHMRSCAKPFQITPLFEMGLLDKNSKSYVPHLRDADIPLFMSSHAGEDFHVQRVQELLALMGLFVKDLRCGSHPPLDDNARKHLQMRGEACSPLHNNCSAKHVAMLLACQHQGYDMASYEQEFHPLQQHIKKTIATLADLPDEAIGVGVDGCSLPSWAVPLKVVALLYARLMYWQQHLPKEKPHYVQQAFSRMIQNSLKYPEFLAGTHRFDTVLMRASGGKIFSKTGADGMQALAIAPCEQYPLGLGIALKITDGDHKNTARPLIIKALLQKLSCWPSDAALEHFMPTTTNYRGIEAVVYRDRI